MLAGIGACALLAFVAYRFAFDGAHALTNGGMALPLARFVPVQNL